MNLALVAACVLDRSVTEREQSVVLAAADVFAGMEVRAMLTHQDVARRYNFAGKLLATKALRVGIATVTCGAKTFLMSHLSHLFLIPR